jgi:hypothetical protein
MFNLTVMEFLFRGIPEMIIFMWGVYVISREKFKIKEYIFSSLALAVLTFGLRRLPIHLGVHTIINNVLTICIIIITGIPIIKAIYSTLFMTLLLIVCETMNVLIINFFNLNIKIESNRGIYKTIIGTPSLIFFAIFVYLIYLYFKKKEGSRIVSNGKNCS